MRRVELGDGWAGWEVFPGTIMIDTNEAYWNWWKNVFKPTRTYVFMDINATGSKASP